MKSGSNSRRETQATLNSGQLERIREIPGVTVSSRAGIITVPKESLIDIYLGRLFNIAILKDPVKRQEELTEHKKIPFLNTKTNNIKLKNALEEIIKEDANQPLFDILLVIAEIAIPFRNRFNEGFNARVLTRFRQLMSQLREEKDCNALLLFSQNSETFQEAINLSREALEKLERDIEKAEAEFEREKAILNQNGEVAKPKKSKTQIKREQRQQAADRARNTGKGKSKAHAAIAQGEHNEEPTSKKESDVDKQSSVSQPTSKKGRQRRRDKEKHSKLLAGRRKKKEQDKGSSSNASKEYESSSWEKYKSGSSHSEGKKEIVSPKDMPSMPSIVKNTAAVVQSGKRWSEIVTGKKEVKQEQVEQVEQVEEQGLVKKLEALTLKPIKSAPAEDISPEKFFELLKKKCNKFYLTNEEENLLSKFSENVDWLRKCSFSILCSALTEFMKDEPRFPKFCKLIELKIISKIFPNVSSQFEETYYKSDPNSKFSLFLRNNLNCPSTAEAWIVYFTWNDLLVSLESYKSTDDAIQCHINNMLIPYQLKGLITPQEYSEYEKNLSKLFKAFLPSPVEYSSTICAPIPKHPPGYVPMYVVTSSKMQMPYAPVIPSKGSSGRKPTN